MSALAEMYVQDVSARKVKGVTEEAMFLQSFMVRWFMF